MMYACLVRIEELMAWSSVLAMMHVRLVRIEEPPAQRVFSLLAGEFPFEFTKFQKEHVE